MGGGLNASWGEAEATGQRGLRTGGDELVARKAVLCRGSRPRPRGRAGAP